MSEIRVLVVDDHALLRRGLQSMLSSYSDIEVVGEASNGPEAIEAVNTLQPDIVLLDIRMPGVDGTEVAHQLQHYAPETRIIIVSAYAHEEHVLEAIRAGAYAYVLKQSADQDLAETIRQVSRGERRWPASLIDTVIPQLQEQAQANLRHELGLTEEDLVILRHLVRGSTNRAIGQDLHCSERTAKRMVQRVATKLGAPNRLRAAAEAIRRGLA
ncbi:MAG TPA: response regulator transcription factor [Anaerolineales bacterium]|jgi:DNA-binding NarL/FixJ family response regulator